MQAETDTALVQPNRSWIFNWFRWCPTSAELLEQAEKKIFSYVKKSFKLKFITIPSSDEQSDMHYIRSLTINSNVNASSTPIVLLHGFAAGIGLWVLNLDSLSEERDLYAFDILGFGRSSRPYIKNNAEEAENKLVESIELWRQQIGLEKFILLGHSMGGFLATSYAIQHPDKVRHLILADPWGFPVPDMCVKRVEIPFWVKIVASFFKPFNPLAGLRAAGPWGPQLIEKFRPDIVRKFDEVIEDPNDVSNYIYHCNAQTPSGESAFKAMTSNFGWAKNPMINRISLLRNDIPITFIYGSRSWVDSTSGLLVKEIRKDSYVDIQTIDGAGHHVYADRAEEFNELVRNICINDDLNGPVSSINTCDSTLQEQHTESQIIVNANKENDSNIPVI